MATMESPSASTSQTFNGSMVLDVDVNMIDGFGALVFNETGSERTNEYEVQIWSNVSPYYPNRYQIVRWRDGEHTTLTPVLTFGTETCSHPCPYPLSLT